MTVLAIVLIIAAIAQFTGADSRANPYASATPNRTPGPRAVFGGDPQPDRGTAVAADTPNEPETRARTAPPEELATGNASIEAFLDRWRETVIKGDVEGQTALYAPTVSRFFRQRNVSNSAVRKTKSQMMHLYPTVNRYDISDLKVESNNGKEAVVSFRKEWDMNGTRRFAGAERQRLRLRRMGGDWKIVGEEETKVYWTKRG